MDNGNARTTRREFRPFLFSSRTTLLVLLRTIRRVMRWPARLSETFHRHALNERGGLPVLAPPGPNATSDTEKTKPLLPDLRGRVRVRTHRGTPAGRSHVVEHISDLSNMKMIDFLTEFEWIEMQGRHASVLS